MSFWILMNYAAWALSAVIFLWLMFDFIKVEKELAQKKKENQQGNS